MEQELFDFLTANGGKGEFTWLQLAMKFNIQAGNKKRADGDPGYELAARAKKACDIWRREKLRRQDLRFTKESYTEGRLTHETYGRTPSTLGGYKREDLLLKKATIASNGLEWLKYDVNEVNSTDFSKQFLNDLVAKIKPSKRKSKKLLPSGKLQSKVYITTDKHLGAMTKDNSIYANKYDIGVAKVRHNEILEDLHRTLENSKSIDEVVIFDLGDAVDGLDGKTTRKSAHNLPQNLDNKGQFDAYVSLTVFLLSSVMELKKDGRIGNVRFVATCNSNHGGDLEYFSMSATCQILQKIYPSFDYTITNKFIDHVVIKGIPYVFSHGKDDEDLKFGMPMHLNEKTVNYIREYISAYGLDKMSRPVRFIKGDLHSDNYHRLHDFTYENCPAMYGSSKWIHNNYGRTFSGTVTHEIYADREPIREVIVHSTDQPILA